jgi:hypothetical protein
MGAERERMTFVFYPRWCRAFSGRAWIFLQYEPECRSEIRFQSPNDPPHQTGVAEPAPVWCGA